MSKVLPFLEWSRTESLAGKVGLCCGPQMLGGLGPRPQGSAVPTTLSIDGTQTNKLGFLFLF